MKKPYGTFVFTLFSEHRSSHLQIYPLSSLTIPYTSVRPIRHSFPTHLSLPKLYKGSESTKRVTMRMGTAMVVETFEKLKHSMQFITGSRSQVVISSCRNFKDKIYSNRSILVIFILNIFHCRWDKTSECRPCVHTAGCHCKESSKWQADEIIWHILPCIWWEGLVAPIICRAMLAGA